MRPPDTYGDRCLAKARPSVILGNTSTIPSEEDQDRFPKEQLWNKGVAIVLHWFPDSLSSSAVSLVLAGMLVSVS